MASKPANSCWSTASSTASCRARISAPRWRASSTIASTKAKASGIGDRRRALHSGPWPLTPDPWRLGVGIFSLLFGPKRPKSKLPIVDVSKRFELIGRRGQGSMSKVWRARDKNIGRIVCLKILDKEKTAKFDARFPGLKRPSEGAVMMMLHHPNIVKTFEHGLTTKGEPYIVMELIEGMGLNFLVETRSPGLKGNRVNLLCQVADGLEYLHGQKSLHRDICPRNVMVTNEGAVKIIDFGLTIPYTPQFCKPGNRTGTPNYLAPELIKRT